MKSFFTTNGRNQRITIDARFLAGLMSVEYGMVYSD